MSSVHVENRLRFAFDDGWSILKWDAHDAYAGGIQRLAETKAIDFVGLHHATTPWFIEVKDFRGYRVENKTRLTHGSLVREVAEKVRDTIAGLLWAHQREALDKGELSPFARQLFARDGDSKVFVVLWLEQDRPLQKNDASDFEASIKRELRWLNPRVRVTNRHLAVDERPIPGLLVDSLPGVGSAGSS